jgi:ubiquinone/menaquinone biosynthesis C-methylase UbiE
MVMLTFESAKKNSDVILQVNTVFHDVEAEHYETRHPEIFSYERTSWLKTFRSIRERYFHGKDINVLDVGTGTGFVIEAISPELTKDDTVIGHDVSQEMLKHAKKTFDQYAFKNRVVSSLASEYIPSGSVDLVTMNSVLHHIPDAKSFFNEIDRILTPMGILIIRHEPNNRFATNRVLTSTYWLLAAVKRVFAKISRAFPTIRTISSRHISYSAESGRESQPSILFKVTERLRQEGIEFEPALTRNQLQALVDIHSPTALGGLDAQRGFDPFKLPATYLPGGRLVSCLTYSFLGKINDSGNIFARSLASVYRRLFPKDGYMFEVIIRKGDADIA